MKKIKLIGIKDDLLYQFWKHHIQEIFQELQVTYILEEVNEIDAIINSGVGAIPALLIDERVLFENYASNNTNDFFKSTIKAYLQADSDSPNELMS